LLKEPLSDDRRLASLDDLNIRGQLDFLSKPTYASELKSLNLEKDSKDWEHFYINNGMFESGDAEIGLPLSKCEPTSFYIRTR